MRIYVLIALLFPVCGLATAVPLTFDFKVVGSQTVNLENSQMSSANESFRGHVTFDAKRAASISRDRRMYLSTIGCATTSFDVCTQDEYMDDLFITTFTFASSAGTFSLPSTASPNYRMTDTAFTFPRQFGLGRELSRHDFSSGTSKVTSLSILLTGLFQRGLFDETLGNFTTGSFEFFDYTKSIIADGGLKAFAGGFAGQNPLQIRGVISEFKLRSVPPSKSIPEPSTVALLFGAIFVAGTLRWRSAPDVPNSTAA